jgi:hypothetical protein
MPIYTFKDIETGEEVEHVFPSELAPRIGDEIMIDKRLLRRTPSFTVATAQVERVTHGYPFVSRALPKGCSPESQTKDGKPIIKSQAHEREVLAKTGYVRADPGKYSAEVTAQEKKMKKP